MHFTSLDIGPDPQKSGRRGEFAMRIEGWAILMTTLGIAACGGGNDAAGGAPGGLDAGGRADASVGPEAPDAHSDARDDARSDAAATPDAGGPVTGVDVTGDVAMLDQKLAAAICAKLTSCCSSTDGAAALAQYSAPPYVPSCNAPPCAPPVPTDAQCEAVLAARLHGLHDLWAASVKRGNMAYDAARGSACVAKVSAATCGPETATALFDGSCFGNRGNEIFPKIAPLGHACQAVKDATFIGECDPASGYCDIKTTMTCVAWKKPGESCRVVPKLELCAPDLNCDGATLNAPGKCSSPPVTVAAGASCDATTGPSLYCPAAQYCDAFAANASGLCQPKKADGAACQYDDECTTARPYSCYPFGAGTCGSGAFCSGALDGGAGDGGVGDAGVGDAASD
jgi:hypothetical protein